MTSRRPACSYHPDRLAATYCERWRRGICLSDKRIYEKRTSGYHRTIVKKLDYCVLCNARQLSNDLGKYPIIVIVIFVLMLLSFFLENIAITFFVILILGGFLIYSYNYLKNKQEYTESDILRFKNSLKSQSLPSTYRNYPSNKFSEPKIADQLSNLGKKSFNAFYLVCFECGTSLERADKFYPNCGDDTKEEIAKHYST